MRADEFLLSAAHEYGHHPAVLVGRATHSFTELNRKADRLAAALAGHGVGRGSVVAAFLDDGFPAIVTLFGVLRAGGVLCAVAPSTSAGDLARILAASGAIGIVTESRLASAAATALAEAPGVRLVVVSGADRSAVAAGCLSFGDVVGALSGSVASPEIDADATAVMLPVVSAGNPAFEAVSHAALAAADAATVAADDGAARVARPFASSTNLVDFVAALRHGRPQRLHDERDGRKLPPAASGFAVVRLALA